MRIFRIPGANSKITVTVHSIRLRQFRTIRPSAQSFRKIHALVENADDFDMLVGDSIKHRMAAAAHFAQAGSFGAELGEAQRVFPERYYSFAQFGDIYPRLLVAPFRLRRCADCTQLDRCLLAEYDPAHGSGQAERRAPNSSSNQTSISKFSSIGLASPSSINARRRDRCSSSAM